MENSIPTSSLYIVGIGASAGGLEALEQFFQAMPPDNGMAFVVIQHLSPDYKSMMAEILSKYTIMPVREAEDGVEVKAQHVYLIPPKKSMTIAGGRLQLTEKSRQVGLTLPIDTFFHSLAKDCGEKSIAIVLSGTGSDGARGIRSIKEVEGMVVAQTRDSAKFDGMPLSAINTGLVDLVLAPHEMPVALLKFANHAVIDTPLPDQAVQIIDQTGAIARILSLLKEQVNVDFSQYKPATVLRRIERRAGFCQSRDAMGYLELIQESEIERKNLYKELLIGVTKFFRNPETFEQLQHNIFPKIFANKRNDDVIRIWVAACSTGEEAYSLAILLTEYSERIGANQEIKIFATDIDADALQVAAAGEYSESTVADVTAERLAKFFIKRDNGGYIIHPKVRKKVVFAQHDLTSNPPFNRLDLISCRNLFIYLQPAIQERILHLFHFALNKQGYLMLGESETVTEGAGVAMFSCEDKHHKLYRARIGVTPALPRWRDLPSLPPAIATPITPMATAQRNPSRQLSEYLQRLLLDKFLPACVLINDRLDVLYLSRRVGPYLELRGIPDYNLLRMVPESVGAYARAAVNNALKHHKQVVYKAIVDTHSNEVRNLTLLVEPLPQKQTGGLSLLLLTFEENTLPNTEEIPMEFSGDTRQYMEEMEKELSYTRETLQATIEELETSNEELQSTNEELLAANEELQATNEELHAVNEELITVNAEHQYKIHELEQLNETVDNLLRCSRVGTVFLDRDLSIRRFTPSIREEIHLRESDIGRPFMDIRHHLNYPELHADLLEVMHTNTPRDVELQAESGNWYLAQLSPYLTLDGRVEGCALNLVNITERKRAEQRIHDTQERLQLAVETGGIGIWELDLRTNELQWDDMMLYLYGINQEHFSPSYEIWQQLIHPEDLSSIENALYKIKNGELLHFSQQFRIICSTGELRYLRSQAKIRRDAMGQAVSLLGISWDETHDVENTRLLQATQRLGKVGGWELDAATLQTVWTQEVYRIHELEVGTFTDKEMGINFYHPEDIPHLRNAMESCIEHGRAFDLECRFITAKGNHLWVRTMGEAVYVGDKVVKLRGLFQDITARKQAENELVSARFAAEAANHAKSAFIANMSHELRTPLNAVLSFAQILAKATDLNNEYQRMAQTINRSGEHLLTLLNDVLELSKIEAGQFELNVEECEIQYFIKNVINIFQVRAQQKGIKLEWRIQPGVPTIVEIDARRVRQILLNLLGNAVKFTEIGSVQLCCNYIDEWLYFTVRDTGIGIAPDQQERIFHPFQQEGSERYKAVGTGLGLSISERLTKLMGGLLTLESRPKQGSTFFLQLPAKTTTSIGNNGLLTQQNVELEHVNSYERTDGVTTPFNILIVDDIHDNLDVLQAFLQPLNLIISVASSGEQCLEYLQSQPSPDLIFMDMKMPGISGIETTRQIRQTYPKLPIIAVSASVLNEDRENFQAVGCNGFISKPIRESDLLAILQQNLPLTWQRIAIDTAVAPTINSVVFNSEQHNTLLTFVKKGEIQNILNYLTHLQKQPNASTAIKQLLELAHDFELKQLQERLERMVPVN